MAPRPAGKKAESSDKVGVICRALRRAIIEQALEHTDQLGLLFEGAAALSTSLNAPTPWTHARKAAATLIDRAAS
jgi:hypothetical protein